MKFSLQSNDIKNKVILLVCVVFSGALILCSENNDVIIPLFSMIFLSFMSMIIVQFNIFHPYVWYSSFFTIYSISYPLLYRMEYINYGYTKDLIFMQWLALATLLLTLPSKSIVLDQRKIKLNNKNYLLFFNNINTFITTVAIIYLLGSGFRNKGEIYSGANIVIMLVFSLVYFMILIHTYQLFIQLSTKKWRLLNYNTNTAIVICLFSIVTGERDYMFTLFLLDVIIFFYFHKIKRFHLVMLVPLAALLIPLSAVFKYTLLSGQVSSININNIWFDLLDGEFVSASRNLQILISHNMGNYFEGRSFFNDIVRIFYNTGYSNQTWFMDTFFPNVHSTKYGFTLVGEGYLNGGYFGIVMIFMLTGFLMRFLYINAQRNIYGMLIYLYMIPIFIYSTRADFANILSPLLKYAILGALVIVFIDRMVLISPLDEMGGE